MLTIACIFIKVDQMTADFFVSRIGTTFRTLRDYIMGNSLSNIVGSPIIRDYQH
jgi:hypothetical protein